MQLMNVSITEVSEVAKNAFEENCNPNFQIKVP
jgi:hypothetical protein